MPCWFTDYKENKLPRWRNLLETYNNMKIQIMLLVYGRLQCHHLRGDYAFNPLSYIFRFGWVCIIIISFGVG
jgi:hypothetical protein